MGDLASADVEIAQLLLEHACLDHARPYLHGSQRKLAQMLAGVL